MLRITSGVLPYEFHELKNNYNERLLQMKISQRFIDKFFNATTIDTDELSYSKTVEMIFGLSVLNKDIEKLVKLRLEDDSKHNDNFSIDYKFDHNLKAAFIAQRSRELENYSNVKKIIKILNQVEQFEIEKNKSILQFNFEDMLDIISYYRNNFINYMTYNNYILVINLFVDYSIKKFDELGYKLEKSWNKNKLFDSIPENEKPKSFIEADELKRIVRAIDNPQDAVIISLMMNGIKLSRIEEDDEIRNIREDDITGNTIHIRGKFERDIKLDPEALSIVHEALEQTFYSSTSKTIQTVSRTGYLLRTYGRSSKNGKMSEYGIQRRLRKIRENYSQFIADRQLTYSTIRTAGRIEFVDDLMYLNKSISLDEAMYESMVKFGDMKESSLNNKKSEDEYYRKYSLVQNYEKYKNVK
ncbi:hypothetical protein [Liquorilactobacillus hordei]|uniref:Tyr recombinase domain-containing protein n=1 Tax=Liquorilactobacillus hordei DSM 19519 TaxID=1423759 RepID=A0A0R1MK05_9LACO|nr:hypothetical protein [Liquorilactobacillus hordei]KRL08033.1 hypothetical protein FC92_GL001106 [Liquorilactobacillus hordei DSM 19519]QYH51023.1 hypothetical protein G6O70_00210 [Liquorilactobacillus hordei DSM 19519]